MSRSHIRSSRQNGRNRSKVLQGLVILGKDKLQWAEAALDLYQKVGITIQGVLTPCQIWDTIELQCPEATLGQVDRMVVIAPRSFRALLSSVRINYSGLKLHWNG